MPEVDQGTGIPGRRPGAEPTSEAEQSEGEADRKTMEGDGKGRMSANRFHGATRGYRGRFTAGRSPAERFWARVDRTNLDGCWLWLGRVDDDGYGRFKLTTAPGHHRTVRAHRFAYEQTVGPIPDGLTLDHVRERGCQHRHCVRPDHLEAVTHQENLRRRILRRNGTYRGEDHP